MEVHCSPCNTRDAFLSHERSNCHVGGAAEKDNSEQTSPNTRIEMLHMSDPANSSLV